MREIVGAPTAIGRRLTNALAYGGRTESIVLLEEPETLNAELLQEEGAEVKAEAEKARAGLTMFTDGSRMEDGAAGCGGLEEWPILSGHQSPYGLQPGGLRCGVRRSHPRTGISAEENMAPERATIFTDAHAAIRRMASDQPSPGQQYALQAREHIAALRRASSSKSDGVQHTMGPPATRRLTSGQRLWRGSETPEGWNG